MDSKVIVPLTRLKARSAWDDRTGGGDDDDHVRLIENNSACPAAAAAGRRGTDSTEYKGLSNAAELAVNSVKQTAAAVLTAGGKCKCCPYGYHIDVDFVRYCESLVSGDYVRRLKQLHRSRRQQRKSAEALLAAYEDKLSSSSVGDHATASKPSPSEIVRGSDLEATVLEFEDTYKTSIYSGGNNHDFRGESSMLSLPKHSSHNFCPTSLDLLNNAQLNMSVSTSSSDGSATSPINAPNFPAPFPGAACCGILQFSPRLRCDSLGSLSTVSSSTTATDVPSFYSVPVTPPSKHMAETMEALANCSLDIHSRSAINSPDDLAYSSSVVCINTSILQSIRDQMAVSLHRMKELEDQAKAIPILQVKLSVLKEEKRLLMLQLKAKAAGSLPLREKGDGDRSVQSSSDDMTELVADRIWSNPEKKRTRHMSVSCTVMTRDIGVGSLPTTVQSVAQQCEESAYSARCQECHPDHVNNSFTKNDLKTTCSFGVQATPSVRDAYVLTCNKAEPQTFDKRISCVASVKDAGTMTGSESSQPPVIAVPVKRDVASGSCSVSDVICENCKNRKTNHKTVAVGQQSILLCDKCSGRRTKSVGVSTDGAGPTRFRNVGSGFCSVSDLLCDRCSNLSTRSVATSADDLPTKEIVVCDKCSGDIRTVAGDVVIGQQVHTTSRAVEFRKRRPPLEFYINQGFNDICEESSRPQSSSSKDVGQVPPAAAAASGTMSSSDSSDGGGSSGESTDEASYDSVRGVIVRSCQDDQAIREGRPGAIMFQPIKESQPMIAAEPSNAMKKACAVVEEHLRNPSSTKEFNTNLNVIRDEWFSISSRKDTNPGVVDDYLDVLESVSHAVLREVVNLTDGSGNTAMHYAISYSNFDVVSLLLDSKVCDVNKPNKAGYTSLMLASLATVNKESCLGVLMQLFKFGDVNAKASQHGQTALMLAASHGRAEMVRLLLEAGADVNVRDDDGSTALMCASEHGHLAVVRLLLSHLDCDPSLADNDGSTALSIAMEAGHKDVGLMIYAATSSSRGSSPCASLRLKRRCSTPTRNSTPPSPAWSRKSTSSVP